MKKIYTLFTVLLMVLVPVWADEQDVEPVVIAFNEASGRWTSTTANGAWAAVWTSTATEPGLTVSCPNNNMAYNDGEPCLYTGTRTPNGTTWTLATSDGYEITEYQFYASRIAGEASSITPAKGEKVDVPAEGEVFIHVTDVKQQVTTFLYETVNGNKGVQLRDFKVTIVPSSNASTRRVIFVYDKTPEHNTIYRIPSIASMPNGRIVALTDYRPGGGDIGQGEVDIHAKYSDDYGKTWSDEIVVVDGTWGSPKGARWYSFGDPVSIADRETGRLLVVSCSGNKFFSRCTRYDHQGVEVFYSEDGGETWSEPEDVSEQIYGALDKRMIGPVQSLFVGSGGFVQSKYVKKGDYYRVYGGILCLGEINYVIYTDDFGKTWEILGGGDAAGIVNGGNEAKVEELPDGSVLLTSRYTGGRIFNIWRWTDDTFTDGAWDKEVISNASNKGVVAEGNSCNGEIRIVPARRVSDGRSVYLAMQSIPFGSGRSNVGIYYKELASYEDYRNTTAFAANWTKGLQVSYKGSAYSAMVLQEDHNIGFMVEEATYGYDFSEVYFNLTYEEITDGRYTWMSEDDPEFDRTPYIGKVGTARYNLMWNGEPQRTVTAVAYYGEKVNVDVSLPAYTRTSTIPALVMDETTDGSVHDVEVKWNTSAPMRLSTDANTYYYYLQIQDGKYVGDDPTKDYIELGANTTYKQQAGYMWRIEGNPFKGLQLRTYEDKVLASPSPANDGNTGMNTHPRAYEPDAVPTDCTTDWRMLESTHYTNGFFLFNCANGFAMNYRAPYLAYWTGGYDAGSTFRATRVPNADLQAVGISDVDGVVGNQRVYNLAGQEVSAPRRGVYVIDGRKVLIVIVDS